MKCQLTLVLALVASCSAFAPSASLRPAALARRAAAAQHRAVHERARGFSTKRREHRPCALCGAFSHEPGSNTPVWHSGTMVASSCVRSFCGAE